MSNSGGKRKAKRASRTLKLKAAPNADKDAMLAQVMLEPSAQAALTVQGYSLLGNVADVSLNALIAELRDQCSKASGGDLSRAEAILTAQAHTLDAIFGDCARRAAGEHGRMYARRRAVSAPRAEGTTPMPGNIGNPGGDQNPAPVAFVRQTNIAAGPQQVNNGAILAEPSRAREIETEPSKLSGGGDELLPDARTSALASGVDPQVETVGKIDGTEIHRG